MQPGQILLPPQVLLVLRTHGGHHVVEVHDDVHERVEHTDQDSLLAEEVFQVEERPEGHCRMVIDMQERHLALIFTQYEKHGVQEIQYFREVVPPRSGP